MKHLLPDNEKIVHNKRVKRFKAQLLTLVPVQRVLVPKRVFSQNLTHQKPSRLWQHMRSFFSSLFGEERPRPMAMWLTLLVALLHVVLAQRLLQPPEPLATLAKPLMMEVALMSAAAPEQSETVTKPVSIPNQPPKIKPLKPIKKKPKPVVRKPVETPKKAITRPVKAPALDESGPEEAKPESSPAPAPAKAAVAKVGTAPKKADVFTEANFQANYGYNPKPVYPGIARRHHWEGQVTLRVHVSADGTSASVRVQRSSGHEELDESAVVAVKKWRFIPAKRGDTPVSSSVLVPIVFNLKS
jgi:protein TonB